MNDLINKVGGIKRAEEIVYNAPMWASGFSVQSNDYFSGNVWIEETEFYLNDLVNSISDHERTDFCTNFENGLSPNTKVINK